VGWVPVDLLFVTKRLDFITAFLGSPIIRGGSLGLAVEILGKAVDFADAASRRATG